MNDLNMDRLAKALSEILSRKHDAKVTITYTPRPSVSKEGENTE